MKKQIGKSVIYLNRPNAFVPPSWHAILSDCYMTKRKRKHLNLHVVYEHDMIHN